VSPLLFADSPFPAADLERAAPPFAVVGQAAPSGPAASRRKRAMDLVVAALALVLFLPILLMIAAAIRAESPGQVLFRQRRTGLYGQSFEIFKFRTMRPQAETPELRQASRGDDRVTRVGKVLRKLSLDELPQLLNVLRGEMSLVGPRPHALSHDEAWATRVPGYAERFRVRPGLTGLAQVRGWRGEIHDDDALLSRIASDNEYVEAWSFRADLVLIARTLPLVLRDPRAY
jgi:putative colanic acid biosynthesis UDP-glucose lipid carrier transferase